MSRPKIDFSNIEAAEQQLKTIVSDARERTEKAERWKALRDSLSPEQREQLYAVLKDKEVTEWAVGALAALKPLRRERAELERRERHAAKILADPDAQCRLRDALRTANQHLERKALQLKEGKAQLAQLRQELGKANPPQPPKPQAPAPAEEPQEKWDYAPLKRRTPRRGEVVTNQPFAVEVVADQVEQFVRHRGQCIKPDVSAAFPQLRPYLAVAYRHLHASRRIRVDGWRLEPWPKQEKK